MVKTEVISMLDERFKNLFVQILQLSPSFDSQTFYQLLCAFKLLKIFNFLIIHWKNANNVTHYKIQNIILCLAF